MPSSLELLEEHRLFGGWQQRYRHPSTSMNCTMTFSIFLPEPKGSTPPPVVWFLAGLTCSDENFSVKSGAQRVAAELGLVLVIPDTGPRGEHVANDDSYDLGQGRVSTSMPAKPRGPAISACTIISTASFRR